ncbi:MAG: lytic murein transglycosylase [Phenylobacterium sp.]|uniref:lytic murein transglycosylase n=1 Tax=Phenylobacterium sp. TaxID=1871053 RepID=UPI0025DF4B80|nr:lytic murein transglycosylase [Phenylobacterium sp.]MCA3716078.1 lytic murein transglycosylase [Phenylobacterium sp.]MCA3724420.1 lytic murein transglycosylase [Phenylobacterium sp.]MCA3726186.1 lytic murein transglycosylase [Phenylobacterium sp.]MCA3731690.1 lytic murein transglycosylase [Phenylobacterium sp.]MCA3749824.1 lytic murein transglycosylase [Phenylobacterium sp.]
MKRRTFLVTAAAALATPAVGAGPQSDPLTAQDAAFAEWLSTFRITALASGLPADVLERELAGLQPDPRVRGSDRNQPEFSRPFSHYVKRAAGEDRAAIGRRRMAELDASLAGVEAASGVPREMLVAIWGMESGYGAFLGDHDVIRSMATLAADGRRRGFAEDQLLATLRIIASGEWPRERLVGSWAGAMGQTQFIPSNFLSLALDADGDGRRDVWGSPLDALASAANLLATSGWARGQGWALEVAAPDNFDYSVSETLSASPAVWSDLGLMRADGGPLGLDASEATLLAPTGAKGPLFLLMANHFVIRRYNNAVTYALAGGLLADSIAGRPGLVRPWPEEVPLSLADRISAQAALQAAGYDVGEPDGVIGLKSRAALRAWQKSRGLVADGYLSPDMVALLRGPEA